MVTVRFDRIEARRTIRGICPGCKKLATRVIVTGQTVNPFNKHEDGRPKSAAEVRQAVYRDLAEQCATAEKKGIYHQRCELSPWVKPAK